MSEKGLHEIMQEIGAAATARPWSYTAAITLSQKLRPKIYMLAGALDRGGITVPAIAKGSPVVCEFPRNDCYFTSNRDAHFITAAANAWDALGECVKFMEWIAKGRPCDCVAGVCPTCMAKHALAKLRAALNPQAGAEPNQDAGSSRG